MIFTSRSAKETQKIAFDLIKNLKGYDKNAIVVALEGELGAGKTVFVKGLAKALGTKEKIKSPTFVLMRKYKPASGLKFKSLKYLYHLDCYRLKDEKDLELLGIKEILTTPHNIVVIEWSDRVKKILPKKYIKIHIDHIDKDTRKIIMSWT